MPIGTVITWPTDGTPSYGGEWLECNGQEVPTKYTALRKLMTRVPDYRGMFLRGYGSQSFSQNNGSVIGNTSTLYQSGSIGAIQGDATRNVEGLTTASASTSAINSLISSESRNVFLNRLQSQWSALETSTGTMYNSLGIGQGYVTYTLVESGGGGEGESVSYSLQETFNNFPAVGNISAVSQNFILSRVSPTSNEIRPVNVAVRYFIKAR